MNANELDKDGTVYQFVSEIKDMIEHNTKGMTSEQVDAYVNGFAAKMFYANSEEAK